MDELSGTIAEGLAAHFEELAKVLHRLAEPLSNEQMWTRPYPYGNSFGHLVLHLTGNLNSHIGAQIAHTGYVREREREFIEENPPSKPEALKRFDHAVAMVTETIRLQSPADWSRPITATGEKSAGNRYGIFLRCASHFRLHIGHMIYLSKELAR